MLNLSFQLTKTIGLFLIDHNIDGSARFNSAESEKTNKSQRRSLSVDKTGRLGVCGSDWIVVTLMNMQRSGLLKGQLGWVCTCGGMCFILGECAFASIKVNACVVKSTKSVCFHSTKGLPNL
ncbi:hypothetical protein PGIGA_G00039480 [Pangasianodon gigas]|uniref:Uncharacterized protein n=1 Tax=Pangasianodon gigas TaxID=30993 RepID=A0ACC5X0J6_PANGG|nr:hypothetical protein [Pangasianodon gigas]